MKRTFLSLIFIICSTIISAQEISVPEFEGQVAIINPDSTTTLLPKESPNSKQKVSATTFIPIVGGFIGNAKAGIELQGTKSETTIDQDTVSFIYRVKDNSTDPSDLIKIVKLNVKKKTREYTIAKTNIVSGSSENTEGTINWTAKKYGENCYIITINHLEEGQYAIIGTGETLTVSTFGVK